MFLAWSSYWVTQPITFSSVRSILDHTRGTNIPLFDSSPLAAIRWASAECDTSDTECPLNLHSSAMSTPSLQRTIFFLSQWEWSLRGSQRSLKSLKMLQYWINCGKKKRLWYNTAFVIKASSLFCLVFKCSCLIWKPSSCLQTAHNCDSLQHTAQRSIINPFYSGFLQRQANNNYLRRLAGVY